MFGVRLDALAQAIKEGFVKANAKKRYPVGTAIKGLFAYYQSRCERLPIYENVHQCHHATGIPLSVIKSARRLSKTGEGNRIGLEALLKAIFTERKEEDWRALREKSDALRAQAELHEVQGKVLDKDEAGRAFRAAVAMFWQTLDRAAQLELPPLLKGCSEQQIRDELLSMTQQMKATIFAELDRHFCEQESDSRAA